MQWGRTVTINCNNNMEQILFYRNILYNRIRKKENGSLSISLPLCESKIDLVVEYTPGMSNLIGIGEYKGYANNFLCYSIIATRFLCMELLL